MIIIRRGEKINKIQQNSIEQEKKWTVRNNRNTGRWKHQQGLERKTRTTFRNSRRKKQKPKKIILNKKKQVPRKQQTTSKITKNSKENKENTNNKLQQDQNNKEIKEQQKIIRTKISSFTMSSQKFKI